MSTWQKTALRIAAALGVLGVVAAIAIHLLVDPEKLKALAHDKARASWSRDLTIGSLDLGFFPVPWLEAHDVGDDVGHVVIVDEVGAVAAAALGEVLGVPVEHALAAVAVDAGPR